MPRMRQRTRPGHRDMPEHDKRQEREPVPDSVHRFAGLPVAAEHLRHYEWRADAISSFHYALHMKALAIGAKRPSTVAEIYWAEMYGAIP